MNIVVFGGSGYIGRNLLTSTTFSECHTFLSPQSSGADGVDLLNVKTVERLFGRNQFDLAINCAAVLPHNQISPDFQLNEDGSANIVSGLQRSGQSIPIVHLSSATEMIHDPHCESPYSQSKLVGFQKLKDLAAEFETPIIRIVLHNVVGRNPKHHGLINELMNSAMKDQDFYLKFPSRRRDFVWIDDCISAINSIVGCLSATSLLNELPLLSTYEVGTGRATTLYEIACKVFLMFGSSTNRIIIEQQSDDVFQENVADLSNPNTLRCETNIDELLKLLFRERSS